MGIYIFFLCRKECQLPIVVHLNADTKYFYLPLHILPQLYEHLSRSHMQID